MRRRLAVVVDQPLIEPTLADVLEWLRRSPATYAQVVEQSQLAGEWRKMDDSPLCFERLRVLPGQGNPEERDDDGVGFVFPSDHGPYWCAELFGHEYGGSWGTAEEAQRAVDEKLRELGWTLVGRTP